MSGTNGRESIHSRVEASLRQPALRKRKAAELSSVERSALMDELVQQLIEVKRELKAMNDVWQQMQRQQNARLDAHANVLLRLRFLDRLRWLFTGR